MSNLLYGRYINGKYIYTGPARTSSGGDKPPKPSEQGKYIEGLVQVIFYDADGTKTAVFSNDTEELPFKELSFEINRNGCSNGKIIFNTFPKFTNIAYGQRIDVFLFGDKKAWWSGKVLKRPDDGGTATSFEISCYGLYDRLDQIILFNKEYKNMELSDIVRDIAREVSSKTGIVYNQSKIYNAGYTVGHIKFDGVSTKEALDDLSKFAMNYVYGVDERREFYFKKINTKINEEARIWVGIHCSGFVPSQSIDKIYNYARVKGGTTDVQGEQWLCTVENLESQKLYERREKTLTLPSAYSVEDAQRWGQYQIDSNAMPKYSAKLTGLILDYPKADGSFSVRKLSTDGQASVTGLDGIVRNYPITKIKYSVSGSKGICCDLELGDQPTLEISDYLLKLHRDSKNNELLQQYSKDDMKKGG